MLVRCKRYAATKLNQVNVLTTQKAIAQRGKQFSTNNSSGRKI